MRDTEAPLVVETPGGLSVVYRGRHLYSPRDPARLPRRAARACDKGPSRLHLAASPLLWHGARELLDSIGPGSAVLFVEADPALAALARSAAPREILEDPRVAFLESRSAEEAARAARALGRFRACAAIALSGGEALESVAYSRMAALISADIDALWRNRAALMVLGRRWARNIFANLSRLGEIAPEPFPRYGIPVAVCGAGPSLEEALPWLADRRGSVAILACDTALGTLLGGGAPPDMAICLEAQAHNLADFVPLGSRPMRLAADLSSHPSTFGIVRGPKHLTFVSIAESPFLDRVRGFLREAGVPALELPPMGSVGVHAVRLARELTEAPLLALGLDFCFEAGKTHARGSPAILAEERRLSRTDRWNAQYAAAFRDRCLPAPCAPGPEGLPLISDPTLLSYAALLGELAGESGAPLYDARGRGPAIGAPRLPLERAGALAAGWLGLGLGAPPAAAGPSAAAGDGELEARVRGFLRGEAERLTALHDIMKGRGRASELPRLVAECDYLYWPFPDAERAASLSQDFLNRLLPETEWWSSRLSHYL